MLVSAVENLGAEVIFQRAQAANHAGLIDPEFARRTCQRSLAGYCEKMAQNSSQLFIFSHRKIANYFSIYGLGAPGAHCVPCNLYMLIEAAVHPESPSGAN